MLYQPSRCDFRRCLPGPDQEGQSYCSGVRFPIVLAVVDNSCKTKSFGR